MTSTYPTCPCGHPVRVVRNLEGTISVDLTPDGPKANYRDLNASLVFSCTRPGCTEDLDEDLCDKAQDLVSHYLTV